MYESPIQLFFDEIVHGIQNEIDGMVYSAVQNVGVNVDKEELIKALQYDRGQYEKGYADAKQAEMENIANRWMQHCRECPKQTECTDCKDRKVLALLLDELDNATSESENCEGCKHFGKWENEVEYGYPVTAWMPQPEPYK